MRRTAPDYFRRPHIAIVRRLFCICGKSFGSSRALHEHEQRCAQVRIEGGLQKREART